jgi:hypothetical protein
LGTSEVTDTVINENLTMFMGVAAALHFCFMLLIYKTNFIKTRTIKKLSMYKKIPILFGMCLLTVIYLKYEGKQAPVADSWFVWILCNAFLLVLPTYLGFYWVLNNIVELKNIKHNENIDNRLEYAAQTAVFSSLMNLNPDSGAYEKERRNFKRKLANLHIDHGCKGFAELVMCLITVKYFEGDNLSCENIIEKVSRLTKISSTEIIENITYIIKKTWFLEESNVFEEYYHKHIAKEEINIPTVEDFLIHMAGRAA